ncbi:hypothetical protein GUJ93_ZPchr0013g36802 [Zizania palustris]|uniref:Uncharacterized protein n=1 Tax=Zizania palustris TaxID=103762 RepID=A0A8J6C1M2_ZIZPA|nr:hypothetical protein GUJ93_ZPchr0013g36802 [Zizania palustris]
MLLCRALARWCRSLLVAHRPHAQSHSGVRTPTPHVRAARSARADLIRSLLPEKRMGGVRHRRRGVRHRRREWKGRATGEENGRGMPPEKRMGGARHRRREWEGRSMRLSEGKSLQIGRGD